MLTSLKQMLNRIWRDEAFRSAALAFTLTRAIVLGVLLLVTNAHREGKNIPAFGGPVEEVDVSLREKGIVQRAQEAIVAADAVWYLNIARDGYEKENFNTDQQHNWAFFPLFPLIVNAAARITGEFPLTAGLVSNIFFFAALIFLHQTAILFGTDNAGATRAVFYLAAFPTSYFFSFPFTESLFLLLTVASFYCAQRQMWWRAGALGAFASATRLAGLFLIPALLIIYWQRYRGRGLRPQLMFFGLMPLGLIAFMIYLRQTTGNALAFFDIQAAWGHAPNFFLRPLFDYLMNPLVLGSRWDFRLLNFWAVVLGFVCCGLLLWRRQWALAVYALISLIVPLSATLTLQSLARYVMVMFPVFFVLALAGRSNRLDQIIRVSFVALLTLMSALFALHVALALA